jgi:hypothetical protein
MTMNILHKLGSAGIITVGTYKTDVDPVYDNYYADPNIDVGIATAQSLVISGIATIANLKVSNIDIGVSGISTLGIVSASSLTVSGIATIQSLVVSGISTVGLGTTSVPRQNSQMSFELTSNTNLRIKVRGTDGVLRSANLTLS